MTDPAATSRLVLVRHGRPRVERGVPAARWSLDPSAEDAVAVLAQQLTTPRPRLVVASPEPKALQTGMLLVPDRLEEDERLREVGRPAAWDDDYRDTASRYLSGDTVDSWEPIDDVRERVVAATRDLPANTVVVGHGLALSLLVASLHDVDVVSFWRELRMPDAWVVGRGLARLPGRAIT